jgi:hypothetical protein
MNYVGLVAALSTFFGVWFGHVSVRRLESISRTIWLPTLTFAAIGITLEAFSLSTPNLLLATGSGILGFTFLWDALEFTRQQNRIKKGYAPANPKNPRHRRLMQECAPVTTIDVLKREPLGRPVSHSEAVQLVSAYNLTLSKH